LPDLNLLRTFLAVYRFGSFTAAAHALGLSQPTVTIQIRSLERQTRRELFQRLPRGVAPTSVADELAARIATPLDALTTAAGHGLAEGVRAEPVHLAGPAELLSAFALPALGPLIAEGVRLRVTMGLTETLLDELKAGRYDLVVSTRRPRGGSLTWVTFADEEFVLVAAPVWADRIKEPLAAEGPGILHTVPLVSYAEDLPIVRRYWRHVFDKRLNSHAAVTVPDLRAVKSTVVSGGGFSVLPRYLCEAELASGALVLLNDPEDPPINTGYLAQRPGVSTNPDVDRVRDHLIQAVRAC
jgi:DNA-binding transcriptional LysR family regulator